MYADEPQTRMVYWSIHNEALNDFNGLFEKLCDKTVREHCNEKLAFSCPS